MTQPIYGPFDPPRVPIGTGPTSVLPFPIVSNPVSAGGLDLTTATGVYLQVFLPDGTVLGDVDGTVGWTATLADVTATTATANHALAVGDVTQLGEYAARPVLIVPGGFVPCDPPVRFNGVP